MVLWGGAVLGTWGALLTIIAFLLPGNQSSWAMAGVGAFLLGLLLVIAAELRARDRSDREARDFYEGMHS
jgi:hypothetical protein